MVQYYDTPISTDKQNVSAPQMRTNFSQINTTFAVDHYDFATAIPNGGFHKAVTTPDQVTAPSTGVGLASFYGLIGPGNSGLLQFSRGPGSAVPSPVTTRQSTAAALVLAPAGTTNVFDFTGVTTAIAALYAGDPVTSGNAIAQAIVIYSSTGPKLTINTISSLSNLVVQGSGSILQLRNSSPSTTFNNVYWTLQFLRIS